MKLLFTFLVTLTTAVALGEYQPKQEPVSITNARVPIGFDDNDRVQLMVEGVFYSTCYQVGPHKVAIDQEKKEISITQNAYVYEGFCLEVEVEFQQVIDLEFLEAGTWKVTDSSSKNKIGEIVVARSTHPGPGPDDYLYAPVKDVYLVRDAVTAQPGLVLIGSFPDSCFTLKDIIVTVNEGVIVVQPISFRRGTECKAGNYPFQVTSLVHETAKPGKYLVHVRSMNGQAINKVVHIQ